MEITRENLPWTTEDIDLWRQFLSTQAGQRLIPRLLEEIPQLLPGGDINAVLIRSGEVRGFQACASALLALTVYPPPPASGSTSENYPDLHDDSRWNDGEKISETKTK